MYSPKSRMEAAAKRDRSVFSQTDETNMNLETFRRKKKVPLFVDSPPEGFVYIQHTHVRASLHRTNITNLTAVLMLWEGGSVSGGCLEPDDNDDDDDNEPLGALQRTRLFSPRRINKGYILIPMAHIHQ